MTEPAALKVNPLTPIQDAINTYGEAIPPASDPVAADLVAELLDRGITPDPDAAEALSNTQVWTAAVTGPLTAVVEACEAAGVTFRIDYTHDGGQGPVARPEVTIALTGP